MAKKKSKTRYGGFDIIEVTVRVHIPTFIDEEPEVLAVNMVQAILDAGTTCINDIWDIDFDGVREHENDIRESNFTVHRANVIYE